MFIYWLIVTLFLVGIGHLLVYEGTLSIPEKKKLIHHTRKKRSTRRIKIA